jgi:hypothetical protein
MDPGHQAELSHWNYDTFRAQYRDATMNGGSNVVTFRLDARGEVQAVRVQASLGTPGYQHQGLESAANPNDWPVMARRPPTISFTNKRTGGGRAPQCSLVVTE